MAKNSRKKIIIVGAGIAGLSANRQLTESGFDVVILEARDRIGGRIYTDNSMGIPLGKGANWIHGIDNNPIANFANITHSKMAAVDPGKFGIFDKYGATISETIKREFDKKFAIIMKDASDLAFNSPSDISLSAALSKYVNLSELTNAERDLFKVELLSIESYIGSNYETLSGKYWNHGEDWPGQNCFLTTSYQPILDILIKNSNIRLETIVTEINTRKDEIEIVTNKANYYADAVIVTVPLGVLKQKDILFNPELSPEKQKSINRLEMAIYNITAIKFPTSFWPREAHAIFFTNFDDSSVPVFFNLHHFIDQSILIGMTGGSRARQVEKTDDESLIKKIVTNFRNTFGTEIPTPDGFFNTRWSQDCYSYGSFSYLPTGATPADYDEIAKPSSDRIFFAGEATSSKYPSTTHGAYLSGLREAERIIKLYGS